MVTKWHPADSCSGHPLESESIIKHSPYRETCLSYKMTFIWQLEYTGMRSVRLYILYMWEPASHRSGWFGRFRPLTKGGSPPSLYFESRCISRCTSLTPRLPSRADVSLDSSAEPLARLSRSAWKCVH